MKHYLLRGTVGLVIGAILGAIIGAILQFVSWKVLGIQVYNTSEHIVRTLIFAVVGAIVLGILGLIIGLVIAALRKPQS